MEISFDRINIGDNVYIKQYKDDNSIECAVISKNEDTKSLTIQPKVIDSENDDLLVDTTEMIFHPAIHNNDNPDENQEARIEIIEGKRSGIKWGGFVEGIKIDEETIQFGGWIVKSNGEMFHKKGNCHIDRNELTESNCILHYGEKSWNENNEFIPAYFQALKNIDVPKLEIIAYYDNTPNSSQ